MLTISAASQSLFMDFFEEVVLCMLRQPYLRSCQRRQHDSHELYCGEEPAAPVPACTASDLEPPVVLAAGCSFVYVLRGCGQRRCCGLQLRFVWGWRSSRFRHRLISHQAALCRRYFLFERRIFACLIFLKVPNR